MRKLPASPGRLALALWSGLCMAVLLPLLWLPAPPSSGGETAFLMFVLALPISPATGMLLNAVGFGRWLPAAEPWHRLAIWLAFFVPGLGQWLAVQSVAAARPLKHHRGAHPGAARRPQRLHRLRYTGDPRDWR